MLQFSTIELRFPSFDTRKMSSTRSFFRSLISSSNQDTAFVSQAFQASVRCFMFGSKSPDWTVKGSSSACPYPTEVFHGNRRRGLMRPLQPSRTAFTLMIKGMGEDSNRMTQRFQSKLNIESFLVRSSGASLSQTEAFLYSRDEAGGHLRR